MEDVTILQGEAYRFLVTQTQDDPVSATFVMKLQTTPFTVQTKTVTFVAGEAFFDLGDPYTSTIGVYDCQLNINYATGEPDKYPDQDDCDGECEFPTLTICASLDGA